MKNLFTIMILMAAWVAPATAAENNIHFGALGGLNFSSAAISPEQGVDLSARNRANVGALAEFEVTPNLALEARGMYVQKGVKGTSSVDRLTADISLNYLTFPLLLKVKANRGRWRPYLAVGAELGFKTNADVTVYINGLEEEDEDFNDGVKSRDFAFDFGGGIEVPGNRVTLLVEGIYSLGLANLVEVPEESMASGKTRTFLVNVGVRF